MHNQRVLLREHNDSSSAATQHVTAHEINIPDLFFFSSQIELMQLCPNAESDVRCELESLTFDPLRQKALN